MSLKDFQIICKLGEGAYSSVYKVKRIIDGQEYALKKVKLQDLKEKEKYNALNEVRILASIRSPYVVSYKEVFLTENTCTLCIIMEYSNDGDLFQKIQQHQQSKKYIKEEEIWSIFIQLVQGLQVLHSMKILHRDIKSANVFLSSDGSVKLGDMNVSKEAKKGLLQTQTGTPYYASPEVWNDKAYDHKSDIWSLGCVLYECCALKPPFRADDMEQLFKKVTKGVYPRIPGIYSSDLQHMIAQLLKVDPQQRLSGDKILRLILERIDESKFIKVDEQCQLLKTIRIPQNLHFLTDQLPKPNYSQIKITKIDKNIFFQSLNDDLNKLPTLKPNQQTNMYGDQLMEKINKKILLENKKNKQEDLHAIYGMKKTKKIKPLQERPFMPSLQDNNSDKQEDTKQLKLKLKPLNM